MRRTRAVAILIKDDKVLLVHRKNEKEYFVFPGGGVEKEETIEQAVIRELKEETTIDAKIDKLLYHHIYDDDTEHFFYLCSYISGEPKLSNNSPEKKKMLEGAEFYNPMWVLIKELGNILLYPLEIRDWFLEDVKNNFKKQRPTVNIKISERRKNL